MRRNKGFTLIELMIVIAIIAVIAAIAIPGLLQAQRASNERNASTSLKTLSSGQADFRANDRDGNRQNDFWTADVAGLYMCYNFIDVANGSPEPVAMIELSVAAADGNPDALSAASALVTYSGITDFANHSTKAGYWYCMMTTSIIGATTVTYQSPTSGIDGAGATLTDSCWHTSKFACVAFPDSLSAGKAAFIINESNTIYKQQLTNETRDPTGVVPPLAPNSGGATGLLGDVGILQWPTATDLKSYWQKLD